MVGFRQKGIIIFFVLLFALSAFALFDRKVILIQDVNGIKDWNGLDWNANWLNSNLLCVGGSCLDSWSDVNGAAGSSDVNGQDINVSWFNSSSFVCIAGDCIDEWADVNGAGGTVDLNTAYNNGNQIDVTDSGGTLEIDLIEGADFEINDNGSSAFKVFDSGHIWIGSDFFTGCDGAGDLCIADELQLFGRISDSSNDYSLTDLNNNAGTLCGNTEYLRGDFSCQEISAGDPVLRTYTGQWGVVVDSDANTIQIGADFNGIFDGRYLDDTDSNWQTSFPDLDSNLSLWLVRQDDGNVWYASSDFNLHDAYVNGNEIQVLDAEGDLSVRLLEGEDFQVIDADGTDFFNINDNGMVTFGSALYNNLNPQAGEVGIKGTLEVQGTQYVSGKLIVEGDAVETVVNSEVIQGDFAGSSGVAQFGWYNSVAGNPNSWIWQVASDGTDANSGNMLLVEIGDDQLDRSSYLIDEFDPRFHVCSSDNDASDCVSLQHDGTNANLDIGSGDLNVSFNRIETVFFDANGTLILDANINADCITLRDGIHCAIGEGTDTVVLRTYIGQYGIAVDSDANTIQIGSDFNGIYDSRYIDNTDSNVWSEGWLDDNNALTQDLNGGGNSIVNVNDANIDGYVFSKGIASDNAIGFTQYSIAWGDGCSSTGDNSFSAGTGAVSTGQYAFCFGNAMECSNTGSTGFGDSTNVSGEYALGFGSGTTASGNNCSAIGTSAECTQADSHALGTGASATAIGCYAIGDSASCSATDAVALGKSVSNSVANTVKVTTLEVDNNIHVDYNLTVDGNTVTDCITLRDGTVNCSFPEGVTDTDTNANTECSGASTFLDGEGNCQDTNTFYAEPTQNETIEGSWIYSNLVEVQSDVNAENFCFEDGTGCISTWFEDTSNNLQEAYDEGAQGTGSSHIYTGDDIFLTSMRNGAWFWHHTGSDYNTIQLHPQKAQINLWTDDSRIEPVLSQRNNSGFDFNMFLEDSEGSAILKTTSATALKLITTGGETPITFEPMGGSEIGRFTSTGLALGGTTSNNVLTVTGNTDLSSWLTVGSATSSGLGAGDINISDDLFVEDITMGADRENDTTLTMYSDVASGIFTISSQGDTTQLTSAGAGNDFNLVSDSSFTAMRGTDVIVSASNDFIVADKDSGDAIRMNVDTATGNVIVSGSITNTSDCAIPSALLQFERTNVVSNNPFAIGNGSSTQGVPMMCGGTIHGIACQCATADGSNYASYEVRINGASQVCDTANVNSANTVFEQTCSLAFSDGQIVGVYANTETGTTSSCVCAVYVSFN